MFDKINIQFWVKRNPYFSSNCALLQYLHIDTNIIELYL